MSGRCDYIVLGVDGLLAGQVCSLLRGKGLKLRAFARKDFDLTSIQASTHRETLRDAVVLNCAAFNAVDRAEVDPEVAFAVNGRAPAALAELAGRLIHFSTDYVFDGGAFSPYTEDAVPAPLSAYGRSKLEGERGVLSRPGHAVLRVACLYGKNGRAFGSLILGMLRKGQRVRADAERRVQPTWARAVAEQTLVVVDEGLSGLFHSTCQGDTTWADFAEELARLSGHDVRLIDRVAASSIGTAKRPGYSVLQNRALQALGLDRMPHWRTALEGYLASELDDGETTA